MRGVWTYVKLLNTFAFALSQPYRVRGSATARTPGVPVLLVTEARL